MSVRCYSHLLNLQKHTRSIWPGDASKRLPRRFEMIEVLIECFYHGRNVSVLWYLYAEMSLFEVVWRPEPPQQDMWPEHRDATWQGDICGVKGLECTNVLLSILIPLIMLIVLLQYLDIGLYHRMWGLCGHSTIATVPVETFICVKLHSQPHHTADCTALC